MGARILDGKALGAELRAEAARDAAAFAASAGRRPGLGVVLVGDHPASRSYVTAKERACAEAGIASREVDLPADARLEDVVAAVRGLNADGAVDGILVQLPLPEPAMEDAVIAAIDPAKDVDGFHPASAGRLLLGLPTFVPCTPAGIVEMLRRTGTELRGAEVCVVGRSRIVGRPLSVLLGQKGVDATVTVCHTATRDVGEHTRRADVVVVAAGRPGTLTADMVRPGATVIDVGVNRVPDATKAKGYRLEGDVKFAEVAEVAGAITPVPGGVGPLTIAMLLKNTVLAARRREGMAPA